MPRRTFIEEIQDPVTGETIVLEAPTEEELDELVTQRFPETPGPADAHPT